VSVDYDGDIYVLPFIYHCADGEELDNASVVFTSGDKVMLEADEDGIPQKVIGLTEGAKTCGTVFVLARYQSGSLVVNFNSLERSFGLDSAIATAFNSFMGGPGYWEGVEQVQKVQFAVDSPFRIWVLTQLSFDSYGRYRAGKYAVTIIDVTNDGNYYLLHNKTVFLPISKWTWNREPPDDQYDGYSASIALNGTNDLHATSVCPNNIEFEAPGYSRTIYNISCFRCCSDWPGDPYLDATHTFTREFCCNQQCAAICGGVFLPAPGPTERCYYSWGGNQLFENTEDLKVMIGGPGYVDFVPAGNNSMGYSFGDITAASHGPCITDPDCDSPSSEPWCDAGHHRWRYDKFKMADCSTNWEWDEYGDRYHWPDEWVHPDGLENLNVGSKAWAIPIEDFVTSDGSSFDYEEHLWGEWLVGIAHLATVILIVRMPHALL
jgi:hypothetical protein